jgi:pimeloyl-ACP methyl ester carboxylesterase
VQRPDDDLYDGRLGELQVPALFLHGSLDPRTEPGEMDRVQEALPRAAMQFIATGKHSPHSEEDAWQECNEKAGEFLRKKD